MNPAPAILTIQRLGAQGDGAAEHEGRQVFVPFALPGEVVEAEVNGERARLTRSRATDCRIAGSRIGSTPTCAR